MSQGVSECLRKAAVVTQEQPAPRGLCPAALACALRWARQGPVVWRQWRWDGAGDNTVHRQAGNHRGKLSWSLPWSKFFLEHPLSAIDPGCICLKTIQLIWALRGSTSPFLTPAVNSAANTKEAFDRVCSCLHSNTFCCFLDCKNNISWYLGYCVYPTSIGKEAHAPWC